MELSKQVTSLELAQKLKSLGVKQESYFFWGKLNNEWDLKSHTRYGLTIDYSSTKDGLSTKTVSAFTVAELGEIMKGKGMGTTAFSSMENKWWVAGGLWDVSKQSYDKVVMADTEADARAKCLVYLLENKLIAPHTEE